MIKKVTVYTKKKKSEVSTRYQFFDYSEKKITKRKKKRSGERFGVTECEKNIDPKGTTKGFGRLSTDLKTSRVYSDCRYNTSCLSSLIFGRENVRNSLMGSFCLFF